MEPIARALHFAHDREIVHRDIKPRNILIDSDGKPFVVDFGLAKSFAESQDLTQTAEAIGTPAYMSPEQAQGAADVDHRTDVYSLGATLYESLTGRAPFRAATVAETQRQVVENEPVPPRKLNPAIDRDLETICLKCLHKEPPRRYLDAEAVGKDLERYLTGEPIRARPLGALRRTIRLARRRPTITALLAALVASLLIGTVVSVSYAVKANKRAIQADRQTQIAETGRQEAERQTRIAHAHRLVAHSQAESREHPQLSLLLAIEAVERIRRAGEPAIGIFEQALRNSLTRVGGRPLAQFDDPVNHMTISRDGHWLAAKVGRCTWLWDLSRPAHSPICLAADQLAVNALTISPDSRWLVANRFRKDGLAVWDLRQSPPTESTILRGPRGCRCAVFSPAGRWLASYAGEGQPTGYLWDFAALDSPAKPGTVNGSGALQRLGRDLASAGSLPKPLLLKGHKTRICSMTFSPDRRWLVTTSQDGLVLFWDLTKENPAAEPQVLCEAGQAHSILPSSCAEFSPDSRWLARGSVHGLQVWDLGEGVEKATTKVLIQHARSPKAVFTSDSRWLITFAQDHACVLWKLAAGGFVEQCVFSGFEVESAMWAGRLVISPDNRWLALETGGNTAFVWELRKPWESEPYGRFTLFKLLGHDAPLSGLVFDKESRHLITSAGDGAIRYWELNSCSYHLILQILT